ncbi:putative ABC multidrug transporter [Xylaria sp. FL0064]|nr:putative ABC multidrug transporter [Xylaria sp. FL0064]
MEEMEKPDQNPQSLVIEPLKDLTLVHLDKKEVSGERPRFGVAFRDLGCYGFVSISTYQATFGSFVLDIWKSAMTVLSKRKPQKVTILHNFEGLVLPGEMLLVLGKPGSGCSTFLKTLAGNTSGFNIDDRTSINYHGTPFALMHHEMRGQCTYLSEHDVHFPELTPSETLAFATSSRVPKTMNGGGSEIMSQDVVSTFRLDDARDTQVGSAIIRGLSGGEKRRTSLAEAFIGNAQFQCWDNSTRGLDSSTALQFIELLRGATMTLQTTVAMSIYQASEAMYENFDKVILLYEGRQIYFGPSSAAVQFFQKLGFVKPDRTTSPDFLTSLTNPEERIIREGVETCVPKSPDEFAKVWRDSLEARKLSDEIDQFNATLPPLEPRRMGIRRLYKKTYSRQAYPQPNSRIPPVYRQIRNVVHRGFLRLRRNLDPIISTLFGHTVLGLIIGSIFYNLDGSADSFDKRSIALFFALVNSAFSPAFEVLTMWAQRPIVEKHRRYAFYYPFTEAISSMLCDLPNKILISVLFHLPVYFLTNLRRSASAFFIYWIFMFVTVLAMSTIFRTIGSLSKTIEQTSAPSAIIIILAIIYTGFVIPPSYMVAWLSWFRWINPLAYAYESVMVNEFRERRFPCTSFIPSGSKYPPNGMLGTVCGAIGAIPGQQDVQGSEYLLIKNLGILLAYMIVFFLIHLLSAEFNQSRRSKGEVLVFLRNHAAKQYYEEPNDVKKSDQPYFSQQHNDLKPKICHIGYANGLTEPKTAGLTRSQGAIIHWNINGWVKPGTLTALMGVSGAGKTTLLDVLSNRTMTGTATGKVCVNGNPRDPSFSRRIGYVQQDDIHLPTATVREALEFSARLRHSQDMSAEERAAHVSNVLRLLEMERCADAIVGVSGQGLNVEQRKRLTIAVEMAAGTELLLFLDEPTSGLDSQTARSICRLLRKLADQGQTVLCTIHQPSSQLFEMFDSLLLLGRGGEQLYFGPIGPDASILTNYFESKGAAKCPSDGNPADWVIQVTSDSVSSDHTVQTWPQRWNDSDEKRNVLQYLKTLAEDRSQALDPRKRKPEPTAPTLAAQVSIVTRRLFSDYWRTPQYLYSKLTVSFGIALVNGISFFNSPLDIQGVTDLLFSIFLVTQQFSTISQQIIPRFIGGRSLFEARERHNESYSWVAFVASNILVELFWQTLASVLLFASWYYPTGMWKNGDQTFGISQRGAVSFLLIWLFCLWNSTLSQALAAGLEHGETAVQIATLFFWLSLVFCGIIVPPNALPRFWIFMYRVSPQTYLMNGLVLAGLGNTRVTCSPAETVHIDNLPLGYDTCGEYLEGYARSHNGYTINPTATIDCQYCPISDTNIFLASFGLGTTQPWRYVGLMLVYVVFNVLLTFGLYKLTRTSWRARNKVEVLYTE